MLYIQKLYSYRKQTDFVEIGSNKNCLFCSEF